MADDPKCRDAYAFKERTRCILSFERSFMCPALMLVLGGGPFDQAQVFQLVWPSDTVGELGVANPFSAPTVSRRLTK